MRQHPRKPALKGKNEQLFKIKMKVGKRFYSTYDDGQQLPEHHAEFCSHTAKLSLQYEKVNLWIYCTIFP